VRHVLGHPLGRRILTCIHNSGLLVHSVDPHKWWMCRYPTRALFGAVPPERHIVLYGADNQSWASVSGALRKGEAKDGEVTLILERRVSTASGTAAATSSSTEYRSS
jgi:hypothetical protein